jgi:hypothetical protein
LNDGDAVAKFLLARQFSRGDFHFDVRLPAADWVEELWDHDLFPVGYPNVISRDGRRYLLFSAVFPLLSAPGLRLFGFRGLFLIPLVGTWLTWWSFLSACRSLRIGSRAATAGLFVIIFGTPLTYYSATFWEHMPALALALGGLTLGLRAAPGSRAPLIGGLLVGLSALLREEHLVLVGALGAIASANWLFHRRDPRAAPARGFLTGLAAALGALFLFNSLAYGHPLGLHAITALKTREWSESARGLASLRALGPAVFEYFPVGLLALLMVPYLWWRRARCAHAAALLVGVSCLILVAVPLLTHTSGGQQLGPRHLFIVMPLLTLAAALGLQVLWRDGSVLARSTASVLALLLAARAVQFNIVRGKEYLGKTYRVPWSLECALSERPERVVAVSRGPVPLAGLYDERIFFRTEETRHLRTLAEGMASVGQTRFLYVCYTRHDCGPFQDSPPSLTFYRQDTGVPFVRFDKTVRLDRFQLYAATVFPVTR